MTNLLTPLIFAIMAAPLDGSTIPPQLHGTWAPVGSNCANEVERLDVSGASLDWYEAHGYLLLSYEVSTPNGDGIIGYFVGKTSDADEGQHFNTYELELTKTDAGMQITRTYEGSEKRINYVKCSSAAGAK